jgi:hypothetical protein
MTHGDHQRSTQTAATFYGDAVPGKKRSTTPATGPNPNAAYDIAYFRRHKDDDPTQAMPGQVFLNQIPARLLRSSAPPSSPSPKHRRTSSPAAACGKR